MPIAPAIDYTNKDFTSLRRAMLEFARYRLPEWTDQSPSDLGVLLVDLFAYMGDVVLYYQDRIANESFPQTAVERRSVMQLLRLVGYELAPPLSSSTELTLAFKPPPGGGSSIVNIPNGAQFGSKPANGTPALTFEYLGAPLIIDVSSNQVTPRADGKLVYPALPVLQSRDAGTEVLGSSTGEPNQSFVIGQSPVITSSLVVEVDEGAGWVKWERRLSLLYDLGADGRVSLSGPNAAHYYVQFDEFDRCSVFFGDGVYGRRPPTGTNNIRATYRVGGGASGNVPAGTIVDARTPIALLDSVTNPQAAAGGTDHEDADHAVEFAPFAWRSGQRAVTVSDYLALARQAGGVAKVRAGSPSWNIIQLYVAPEGDTCRPVPESMRQRLLAFFEDKRMAGTTVDILDAVRVPIDVGLDIVPDARYRGDAVRQGVEAALASLLAFANVDFGQPFYLSDIYRVVERVSGVSAMLVTRLRRYSTTPPFQRQSLSPVQAPAQYRAFQVGAPALQVQLEIDGDGRVDLADWEIPALGALAITLRDPR